jgi:glucokinase
MSSDAKQELPPGSVRRAFVADLGGTHLRTAVVDDTGQICFRAKQQTPHAESAQDIVDALVAAARECDARASAAGLGVDVISIVAPGTINVAEGSIVKAPNLPFLSGFALANALSRELKRPAILENDANAAAVGEMWQGAARGQNNPRPRIVAWSARRGGRNRPHGRRSIRRSRVRVR